MDTPSGVNSASGEEPVTAGAPDRAKIVLFWTIATTAGLCLDHLCYQYVFYHWYVSALTGQAAGVMPLVILPISVAQSLIRHHPRYGAVAGAAPLYPQSERMDSGQHRGLDDLVLHIVRVRRSLSKIFVHPGLAGRPKHGRTITRVR